MALTAVTGHVQTSKYGEVALVGLMFLTSHIQLLTRQVILSSADVASDVTFGSALQLKFS